MVMEDEDGILGEVRAANGSAAGAAGGANADCW